MVFLACVFYRNAVKARKCRCDTGVVKIDLQYNNVSIGLMEKLILSWRARLYSRNNS